MRSVTSVNVAAGFHGGDPSVLRRTIALARELGVAVGAHPSFPDLRASAAARCGSRRRCRGPGALSGGRGGRRRTGGRGAARAREAARRALQHGRARSGTGGSGRRARCSRSTRNLFCPRPPRSALAAAGRAIGLRVAGEGFRRPCLSARRLARPAERSRARSSRTSRRSSTARMQMAVERTVTAIDGSPSSVDVDTICIHGDNAGAAAMAAWIRAGLNSAASTSARPVRSAAHRVLALDAVVPLPQRLAKPRHRVERAAHRFARDAVDDRSCHGPCDDRHRSRLSDTDSTSTSTPSPSCRYRQYEFSRQRNPRSDPPTSRIESTRCGSSPAEATHAGR